MYNQYHFLLGCLSLAVSWRHILGASLQISDDDLNQLADNLWMSDTNRPTATQVQLDYQQYVHYNDQTDKSPKALFVHVDSSLLSSSTYKALLDLYPFYKARTGELDTWSNDQNRAAENFLDQAIESGPMRHLRQFMERKGYPAGATTGAFKEYLKGIWFKSYSRAKGIQDSSGFEHVFLDEQKVNNDIGGLHNWIRAYYLEDKSALDYAGYDKHSEHVASISYRLYGQRKSSSMFMLTSPEYDMALYTMCYLFRQGKNACKVELPDCSQVSITTFNLSQNKQNFIGSAYASPNNSNKCTRAHVGTPLSPKSTTTPASSKLLTTLAVAAATGLVAL